MARHRLKNEVARSALLFWMVILIAHSQGVSAEPNSEPVLYRNASSILMLSPEEAARGALVHLRGVVTDPGDGRSAIIQDRTAGIWIYLNEPESLSKGDVIEIDGRVRPGLFSPAVDGKVIHRLGRGPLPKPKVATYKQISTGELDSQYVTIQGTILSIGSSYSSTKFHMLSLQIAMKDGVVTAAFPDKNAPDAQKLIGATVKITAPVVCMKNENMQIIAPLLSGDNFHDDVKVLKSPLLDPFELPLMSLNKLMQYRSGTDYWHWVHVAGVLTYYKPGDGLYIENGGQALFMQSDEIANVVPGDWVEAIGLPASRKFGPILEYATFRHAGGRAQCDPISTSIDGLSNGALNNVLVRVEGRLIRSVREPSGNVFLIQDNSGILLAELSYGLNVTPPREIQEGTMVAITGISSVEVEGTWNYEMNSAFSIRPKVLLRSQEDIVDIQPPTWWTLRHLVYISIALSSLLVLLLAQFIYARIRAWRIAVIQKDKERLSNEIHDTLAQSFAGIGFQLQAIRKGIPADLPDLQHQMEHARDLVRYSHKEALRSIAQLESDSLLISDPVPTLVETARKLSSGGGVAIDSSVSGESRTLPARITDALIRIGQEAIRNAVRHAEPKTIHIAMVYGRNHAVLAIRDDGAGFRSNGDLLGFGLRGMRNRAAAISATFEVQSEPGRGTSVIVRAPIPTSLGIVGLYSRWKGRFTNRNGHVYTNSQSDKDFDR